MRAWHTTTTTTTLTTTTIHTYEYQVLVLASCLYYIQLAKTFMAMVVKSVTNQYVEKETTNAGSWSGLDVCKELNE